MGGVSVEIADAALRTQGYTVSNRIMPWARALEETRQGRIDVILDAWWSQERSEGFIFSRPYINGPVKFLKRAGDPFRYSDTSSLKGKSIALVRNYAYGDEFLNATNYEPVLVTHFLQGAYMLSLGRVDLAIENELVARSRFKRDAPELLNKLQFAEQPLGDHYVYVIAGYKHPEHLKIIGAFNKGLKVILENGTYRKILKDNALTMPKMFVTP
jgi:polar amino acid transport system substrate-binding protein